MKTVNKIVLAAVVGASVGVFSTSALAEASDGRIIYAPADAIDLIISKVQAAIDTVAKGAEGEEATKVIKAALDSTKELNASDLVGMRVQRANTKLKTARGLAKEEKLQEAEQELRGALKMFQEIKGLI